MFLKKGIALSLICLLGFGVMGCSNNSGESKESLKKKMEKRLLWQPPLL